MLSAIVILAVQRLVLAVYLGFLQAMRGPKSLA